MFWRRTARVDDKYSSLMNKDDLIKEQFKQALNSTIKAISGETYPLKDKKNLKENFLIILHWNKIFQKLLHAIHFIKFLKK